MPVVWAGASGPREPDSSPRCCTSSSWPRRAACPEPGPPDVSRRPSHASAASPRGRLTRAEDNQVAPQHQRATTHGFRVVLTIGLRVGNLESHPGIGVRTRTHQDRERGRRDHETSFKGLSKAQESAPSRRTYVLLKRRTRLASPSGRAAASVSPVGRHLPVASLRLLTAAPACRPPSVPSLSKGPG